MLLRFCILDLSKQERRFEAILVVYNADIHRQEHTIMGRILEAGDTTFPLSFLKNVYIILLS